MPNVSIVLKWIGAASKFVRFQFLFLGPEVSLSHTGKMCIFCITSHNIADFLFVSSQPKHINPPFNYAGISVMHALNNRAPPVPRSDAPSIMHPPFFMGNSKKIQILPQKSALLLWTPRPAGGMQVQTYLGGGLICPHCKCVTTRVSNWSKKELEPIKYIIALFWKMTWTGWTSFPLEGGGSSPSVVANPQPSCQPNPAPGGH